MQPLCSQWGAVADEPPVQSVARIYAAATRRLQTQAHAVTPLTKTALFSLLLIRLALHSHHDICLILWRLGCVSSVGVHTWPINVREKLNFKKANDTQVEPLGSLSINAQGRARWTWCQTALTGEKRRKDGSQPSRGINGKKFLPRQTRSVVFFVLE